MTIKNKNGIRNIKSHIIITDEHIKSHSDNTEIVAEVWPNRAKGKCTTFNERQRTLRKASVLHLRSD